MRPANNLSTPADNFPAWVLADFERLSHSKFRAGIHLNPQDRAYALEKGPDILRAHAAGFIARRLAPADIPNDGKQTPWRGHPVFEAQHATACCCRGCLAKWHHIPAGRELTPEEQQRIIELITCWIQRELAKPAAPAKRKKAERTPDLF